MAAELKLTTPGPFPVAPDVIVIHDALLTAVHAHPPDVVTDDEPAVTPVPID